MTRPPASSSLPAAQPPSERAGEPARSLRPTTSFPLQRLRALLADDRALALLLPEARRLAELNRLFARVAPAGLARACRLVGLTGETALIYCGHGVAAARVRSQAKTLARALSVEGRVVREIQVKVRADWAAPDRPVKRGMDDNALAAWQALERTLPPGGLKEAVAQLLRHQGSGIMDQGSGDDHGGGRS